MNRLRNSTGNVISDRRLASILVFALILLFGCEKDPGSQLQTAREQVAGNNYPTAMITLKNLLQAAPENMQARLLLAQVSLALGDPLAAEKELTRARDLGSNAADYMSLHFGIQESLGRHAAMLELLAMDTSIDGLSDVEALYFRGQALLGLGSSIEAEQAFRDALMLDSTSSQARWGIAASLAAQGQVSESDTEIEILVSEHPDYTHGWLLKGQNSLRVGQLQNAARDFQLAVDTARATPDRLTELMALAGLADAQLGLSDLASADATIRLLGGLSGPIPITQFLVARLAFAREDYLLAAGELEQVLNTNPNNMPVLLLYGSVNMAQKNYAQAETVLSRLVALAPENLAARKLLAAAQVQLAEPGAALETLAPLLETAGDDPQLSVFASQAMLRAGSVDQAIELLERSIAADPENADLILTLAATYLTAQRFQEAAQLAESLPADAQNYRRELLLAVAYSADDQSTEAERQIESIMARHADDVTALTLSGDYYLQRDNYDRARTYLFRAIGLDDANIPARLVMARLEGRLGNTDATIAQYERVLREDASNIAALTALADLSARANDLDRSILLLLRAVEANERSPYPKLMLAKAYLRQGKALQAEQFAQEAARLGPEDSTTLATAGQILVDAGKYREALGYLRSSVEIRPEASGYWFNLARAQLALGQNVDARGSLEKTLELEPDSIGASTGIALLELKDGYPDRALAIARNLQTQHPEEAAPISLEADIQMNQRQFAAAAESYRKVYAIEPSGIVAIRAYQTGTQAGLEGADRELQQWVDEHPEDSSATTVLAQYKERIGDTEEAVRHYQRAIESNDQNVGAMNNLAWIYNEHGDARAEDLARRAYELRPDVGAIADTLGWILVTAGETEEGARVLEDAVEKSPQSGDIRYHLAVARNNLGDREGSVDLLTTLLASTIEFAARDQAEVLLNELQGN